MKNLPNIISCLKNYITLILSVYQLLPFLYHFPVHHNEEFTSCGKLLLIVWNKNIYNAITQNICFVKGSHKYDIYLGDKNKAHLNWPNKGCISIFIERNVI